MSQELSTPSVVSYTWSEAWIKALTQPTVRTFEAIANDPKATANRAYIWVAVSSLIAYVISMALQLMLGTSNTLLSQPGREGVAGALGFAGVGLGTLVCCAPFVAAFAVLGLAISAGITQLIASALGGTGTYSKLAYAIASYYAPITLITGLIGSIPFINCLAYPVGIYAIVLNVIAVKAVHQFGWGKAVASSVLILAAILVFVAVVVIVILALLGPAIGNIFSNIVENI
jgi:hypothetical protein